MTEGEAVASTRHDAASQTAQTPPRLSVESLAIYAALASGVIGAITGIIVGLVLPPLPLSGTSSFGSVAAVAAGVVAAVAGGVGYWRARGMPGQEWRQSLSTVRFTVNTVSVVLVHVVLAMLSTIAVFLILSLGFIGLEINLLFWAAVLMAVVLGLSAYLTFLSVSRITTQRMSSLLMSFVVIGTLTSMVTTTDPLWWETHFSHLGTFWSLSSLMFNGTLVIGGLLVTTFAVYLANDMRALTDRGILTRESSPQTISTMFVIMGAMLAGVGLVPVNISLLIHNLCASGMALMYIGMLVAGPRILRGMPRVYFVASWVFLGAVLGSTVLFVTRFFTLTAFEIVVFALIFGWISVFIRFLGVAGQRD
ncbi:hypothetical protein [Microbacterium invictum]|uniref:DUF998 domain-containing protein n=1 Tax=Microbacterium invictum TaxID=515415 RepID=A0AA40SR41_9MICO|nr:MULTISPECIES: hypothetical protein [Microbacterium]MBB4140700.1 hypothetical protein [Microbacterium invictum]